MSNVDRDERLRRIMEKTNAAKSQLAKVSRRAKKGTAGTPEPVTVESSIDAAPASIEAPAPLSNEKQSFTPQVSDLTAVVGDDAVQSRGEKDDDGDGIEAAGDLPVQAEEVNHPPVNAAQDLVPTEVAASLSTDVAPLEEHSIQGVMDELDQAQEAVSSIVPVQDVVEQPQPVEVASLDLDLISAEADNVGATEVQSVPQATPEPSTMEMFSSDFDGAAEEAIVHEVDVGGVVEEDDGIVDDIQEDVLPIVLEEAQEELVPEIDALLERLFAKDHSAIPELHRKVHTLKGALAMVGAMRGRALMHSMETWMEKAEAGEVDLDAGHERLAELFENVKQRIAALARGDHLLPSPKKSAAAGSSQFRAATPVIQTPRRVHLRSDDVDRYITEINEARLANTSLSAAGLRSRQTLSDLEEKALRLAKILRELEIHAESQIQSRRTQVEEAGEEFDPLEFDRYTHLQEITRFLSEGVNDVMDLQRDMVHQAAEQETVTAYQGRAIESVQEGLQRTRLIPADALADRLHKVAWATSRELSRPSEFYLEGGRQALDRMLLEKIASPLEHILRNAIAHGIESPDERKQAGKPAVGSVTMQIRQEAGRVHIVVKDDGRGLDPEKIRQKAVAKNMWPASRPMGMPEAADMICSAGFSTADSVSEIAGRGVGMDVVRSEVMAMGGRFDIRSTTGKGMTIAIVLPTAIASISVVLVEAGGETWAVPVEMVEHMDRISQEKAQQAISEDGSLEWSIGQERCSMRYRRLSDLMRISQADTVQEGGALLILRTGDQRAAIFVDALAGVAELPMRSLGRQWSAVPGVMGATILPSGRAGFLVDPLRADWSIKQEEDAAPRKRVKPLVMVVDDSITVRKVTARFLERNGYDAILAKDGQEAVEMLVDIVPDAILLDVEMPRMDGFDCARHIRENQKVGHVPIIMITSRTADKHRQRALSMGVNAYLGKPYKEEELLPLLRQFAGSAQTLSV